MKKTVWMVMSIVYMIKSNKEIKGSTVTSINYLEDDIQKAMIIIIETTLFHRSIKDSDRPKKLNQVWHTLLF